jgi:hypothetical protein
MRPGTSGSGRTVANAPECMTRKQSPRPGRCNLSRDLLTHHRRSGCLSAARSPLPRTGSSLSPESSPQGRSYPAGGDPNTSGARNSRRSYVSMSRCYRRTSQPTTRAAVSAPSRSAMKYHIAPTLLRPRPPTAADRRAPAEVVVARRCHHRLRSDRAGSPLHAVCVRPNSQSGVPPGPRTGHRRSGLSARRVRPDIASRWSVGPDRHRFHVFQPGHAAHQIAARRASSALDTLRRRLTPTTGPATHVVRTFLTRSSRLAPMGNRTRQSWRATGVRGRQ